LTLSGKTGIVAYGIARACRREGAELAFSYQGERFRERVAGFAAEFGSTLVYNCDVAEDAQIEALFAALGEAWPTFDGFVHSIGYAPKEAIAGDFLEGLSREAFKIAHDISSYSFPALAKAAASRLTPSAALLTLTYLGAERSVPNYNTMAWPRRRWRPRSATWRRAWGRAASGSTASRPGRSRRWRPPGSRASARSSTWSSAPRRCAAT
jgi:enoyl-[acyl-carrier-protein] reductase (NADH)